jgi:hypothetical protein
VKRGLGSGISGSHWESRELSDPKVRPLGLSQVLESRACILCLVLEQLDTLPSLLTFSEASFALLLPGLLKGSDFTLAPSIDPDLSLLKPGLSHGLLGAGSEQPRSSWPSLRCLPGPTSALGCLQHLPAGQEGRTGALCGKVSNVREAVRARGGKTGGGSAL